MGSVLGCETVDVLIALGAIVVVPVLVMVAVLGRGECSRGGGCTRAVGVIVVVAVLVAVGVLGAQDFGSQSGVVIVRVKVSVFMKIILRLEVVVVVEVLVLVVVQIRSDEPSNIPSLFAVEVSHAPQSVCAKDDAPLNISSMLVTLDTSHLERSPLNDDAE